MIEPIIAKTSADSGANLFWAESFANPRVTEKETKGKRGMTAGNCRKMFQEADWKGLEGPSSFFAGC